MVAKTTQGRVVSIQRQITLMDQRYLTINIHILLENRLCHKEESIHIRPSICLTTIGCKRLEKPTTIMGIKASQLPTLRFRTPRRTNKLHSRLHEDKSEMQRNDLLLAVLEV